MKLLILVEIEGLPRPPELLEEMLRHLILWESKGASILFYTSNDLSTVCDNLIDLAPSIVSKRTILPILSTKDLATLDNHEIAGIKYNTVMKCVEVYNRKHPDNPINNYSENVIVLDSSSHFVTYISRHANCFTAYQINNETHSHLKQLAVLYNTYLQLARDNIQLIKEAANIQQQNLKNSQVFLRLRYEQTEIEIENVIAGTMLSFLQTMDQEWHQPSQLQALKTHCYKHLDTVVVPESLTTYEKRILQYGEAVSKTDGNLYRLLILTQQGSTDLDQTAITTALDDYRKRLTQQIIAEKSAIDAILSYTEFLARYKTLNEETANKLDAKVTETGLAEEEIDQNIKAIKKEYDETVDARKQDILNESLLYTGDALISSASVDRYDLAFDACRAGNLAKLKTAIDAINDFKINRLNKGKSLLESACEHAYLEIVRYLVYEKNADVDSAHTVRRPIFSALHGLKQYPNCVELLQILLEKGASMGSTIIDCEGNTPLHVAAQQANVKAFQLIALWITGHQASCVDLCATNKAGRTALLEAIYADNFSTRLPIIEIMFTLGIGISRDEIEILRRDGKLKLDIMKDVAEKYFLMSTQPPTFRRDSIVTSGDRLMRTRNLSGSNLSPTSIDNSSKDLTGKNFASASSLAMMPTTPRRSSFIDSTSPAAAAAATSPATSPSTPRARSNSILSLNLTFMTSPAATASSSSSTPPGTPTKLPLDALRASETLISSPRNSSGGASNEQNRPRSRSIRNAFGLFSPRNDSPSKQPVTLFEAVRGKNYDALRTMLKDLDTRKKRSEANQRGDNGTALYEAVIQADKEAIKCFYDAGLCLSKIEIQMLLSDANNRGESVRALNDVIQEIRNLLSDNHSPRPERRRNSILTS